MQKGSILSKLFGVNFGLRSQIKVTCPTAPRSACSSRPHYPPPIRLHPLHPDRTFLRSPWNYSPFIFQSKIYEFKLFHTKMCKIN